MSEQQLYRRVLVKAQGDPDILDDFREVTIALVAYPLMVFVDVRAPASARPREHIRIEMDIRNDGGDGTMYIRFIDLDTGEEVAPRYEWSVPAGWSGTVSWEPIMPNKDWHLRLELGHTEL